MTGPITCVCAPPGTGKSTLVPLLVDALPGTVVIDMDEILDERGGLLGVTIAHPDAAQHWPAYNQMWERIIGWVRRAGVPLVLLGPVPDEEDVAATSADPGVRWLGLLGATADRHARLRARGWGAERLADADVDAALLVRMMDVVRVTDQTPAEVAALLLDRIVDLKGGRA